MMTSRIPFRLLYFLAFALALTVRLIALGSLPLSDREAELALQALGIVRGQHPLLGPHPAYTTLTAGLFFVFGAGNFLARFWPAVVGSLLALLPRFMEPFLGRRASLILAFILALDPAIWALSRLAGSNILAIAFLTLTLSLWANRHYTGAGICAALALLAGPSFWFGLVALSLTWLVTPLFLQEKTASKGQSPLRWFRPPVDGPSLRAAWPGALGVLLLVGSLFLLVPNGLSSMAASLPAYLQGWWLTSQVPVTWPIIALFSYELLPLILGLTAAVRGFRQRDLLSIRLSLWALIAFLLALLYPGRQVEELAWTILPLGILAAREIERHLTWDRETGPPSLMMAAFSVTLLSLFWLILAGLPTTWIEGNLWSQPHFQLALGALVLWIVSLTLVGSGWGIAIARRGGVWGVLLALIAFAAGTGTGAAGIRQPPTVELWQPSPSTAQADLLLKTVHDLSIWNRGQVASLPVRLVGLDSPALLWLLRDYPLESSQTLAPFESPEIVITPVDMSLAQSEAYRGQDFVWYWAPRWQSASGVDWINWWLFRTMPQTEERVILWARSDLTLGE